MRLAIWHVDGEGGVLLVVLGQAASSVCCQGVFDLVQERARLLTIGVTHVWSDGVGACLDGELPLTIVVCILRFDVVVRHLVHFRPTAEALVQEDASLEHWGNLLMLNDVDLLAYLLRLLLQSILSIFVLHLLLLDQLLVLQQLLHIAGVEAVASAELVELVELAQLLVTSSLAGHVQLLEVIEIVQLLLSLEELLLLVHL